MNTSIRTFVALLMVLGSCYTVFAQNRTGPKEGTIELRIIDPSNTAHPTARTQQIRSGNELRFVDKPAKAAVHRAPQGSHPPQSDEKATAIKAASEPALPTRYRLVQAEEDATNDLLDELESSAPEGDFSDLLERAKDLINNESDESRLGDTEPLDDARQQMRDELESILSGEDNGPGTGDDIGPELNGESGADEETFDDWVDPEPLPIRRRVDYSNQPYTLGAIFDDEITDPQCEAAFCRAMWACAGGRGQNWWQRARRSRQRDLLIRNSGGRLPPSPMENCVCPKIPNPDAGQYGCGPNQFQQRPPQRFPRDQDRYQDRYQDEPIEPIEPIEELQPLPGDEAPLQTPPEEALEGGE